ncbi:unnamed protein product [Paramecium octaurelia]|uniref:Tetratricopeptide repeat protein n=1 Tax=Paramecium octaurelia TaxID=43137 RepID=A0A8S1URL3_PAROT|nr:unnamed protein product [Paramecium octaurelia]CAD8167954.1 unnamed protein product [Paramecium octaurelia]
MISYPEALKCFEQAIEKNPEDYEYFIDKTDTLRSMNKAKEALDSYNQAIQRFPKDERIYGAKGIMSSENYDEALKYFDKAIQMNPQNPSFYAGKGDTLRDMNRYQDSLKQVDQAIHYNPENSFYYGAKANALMCSNYYDELYDTSINLRKCQNMPTLLQIGIQIQLIIMSQNQIFQNTSQRLMRL